MTYDTLRITVTWTQRNDLWASKRFQTISTSSNKTKFNKTIKLIKDIMDEKYLYKPTLQPKSKKQRCKH